MPRAAVCATLQDVDVECTQCGVRMSSSVGGGGTVRYYRCPKCARWVSSMYTEIFEVDAKVRIRPQAAAQPKEVLPFAQVKDRLERWLRGINLDDPYGELGASPRDSDAELRARYQELARAKRPDAAATQRLNDAWDRIQAQRARDAATAAPAVGLAG